MPGFPGTIVTDARVVLDGEWAVVPSSVLTLTKSEPPVPAAYPANPFMM
jgi:hypothetical protein